MNSVNLIGRLTKEIELRYSPNGNAVARFTIAINRQFTNQNGEREADFVSCVAFKKQAENSANYLKKGSLCGVTGRIQTGSYEGQDGKRVFTTDVVADSVQFLEPRGNAGQSNQGAGNQNSGQHVDNSSNYSRVDDDPFGNSEGPIEVDDSDLPF